MIFTDLKKLEKELIEIRRLAAPLQFAHNEAAQIINCCDRIQDAIREYKNGSMREWKLRDKVSNNLVMAKEWAVRLGAKLPSINTPKAVEKKIVELALEI